MTKQNYSASGPYRAGWQRVTVTRPGGGTFNSLLFYPATVQAQNAPYDGSNSPYPGISFGHGFLQPPERYRSLLEHLATWGYFVMATESGQELFPNHQRYSEDMRWCLNWLEQQNASVSATLYQQVDTAKFGISGHSMGGGASILATAADPRIKALANLAAANTNPSAIAQMPNVGVPVSLISGSADTIVPVGSNGQAMYDNGRAPRQIPIIQGGWHCGFQDVSSFGCDSGPLSRTDQLTLTRRLLTAFFQLYLKGDLTAWRWVWGPESFSDSRIVLTSDPGVTLTALMPIQWAERGRSVEFQVEVTNRNQTATAYQLLVEGTGWRARITPQQTPSLSHGDSSMARLRLEVPRFAPRLFSESFLFLAHPVGDPLTRQFVALTARARGASGQVFGEN